MVQDCDGPGDADCDGDGHDAAEQGGDDCDDADPAVYPGATETWYDGVDADCAGDDDDDADGDGHDAEARGGDDCDDADPDRHPGVERDGCGGGDEDCDGVVDEDCGADTGGGDDTGDGGASDGGGSDGGGSDGGAETGWTDPNEGWSPPVDTGYDPGVQAGRCGCAASGAGGGWTALLGLILALRRREDRGEPHSKNRPRGAARRDRAPRRERL